MTPSPSPWTEERVRAALGAYAEQVQGSPDAFERAQATWRRRERRRRLLVIVVAVLVIAAADLVGLWALNHTAPRHRAVFGSPPPAQLQPARSPTTPVPPPPG